MNVKNEDILLRNNTGNRSKTSLLEGFVVRTREFEQVFGEIKASKCDKPEQNYLIIGQRGTGKTTLLYKLRYAIEDDPQLSQSVIPIMFAEEQYHISELANLWESIAEYLEDGFGWNNFQSQFKDEPYNLDNYEETFYYILEDALKNRDKKIIVFIENINTLFKKIGEPGQQRLREVLTTSNYIRIIGTSTSYFDGITDYSLPFYNFFKVIQLGGLNKKESIKLLLKIGEQYGAVNEIKTIIKEHPGRVESLRRLTGGIPRTISYLFQIFLDNENGKAIKDLYQLIDTLSLLYKSELDQLSAQQQKVIDVIARSWDAIAVKEIVKKTRYESKNVSSILSILQKNQIIETVPTKSKNNLYRLKERFMNIWYLMRFGRKHDKDNIIWLVRFFDAWCDETELAKRITLHMTNLKDGKYDVNAAIDMGNTFLSCENVSESLKYSLFEATKSALPERLRKAVSVSNKVLMNKMNELIEKEEYPHAVRLLNEMGGSNENRYMVSHWLYLKMGKYNEAVEAANQLLELEPGNPFAAISLGVVYEDYLFDVPKAEQYFKIALEHNHPYAASRLGQIAFYLKNDLQSAVVYHRQAVKRGFKPSILNLIDIYLKVGDVKQAEILSMEAVEGKVPEAYLKLGNVFYKRKLYKKAEEAYLKSVDLGETKALANLGVLFSNKRNPDLGKAKLYFEKAIEAGIFRGYNLLGKLYLKKFKDQDSGVQTLQKGVDNHDPESAHTLAHFFESKGEYEKSDNLFINSFEWGKHSALLCLIDTIYMNGRRDKSQFALDILESNINMIKSLFAAGRIMYSKILLWNNKIEKSLESFKESYGSINDVLKGGDNDFTDSNIKSILESVSEYILLLLAKEQYNICFTLFKDDSDLDFKMLLRPFYFVMMENFKDEYPSEYLKAGDELKETIGEIKNHIQYLKNNVVL